MWLMQFYQGYASASGRTIVEITIDPDGLPTIGKNIIDYPVFNLNVDVTNPYTQETRPLTGWFTETAYVYNTETEL